MTTDADLRIIAVVVTYNRLALVRRLVQRLVSVPQLDEVLVIDNASRDGTGDWLASTLVQEAAPSDLTSLSSRRRHGSHLTGAPQVLHRTLATNRGGAGGFHDGLGWAIERGADLVWLMDDDGLPEPDCLQRLLEHTDLDFWGPAVVAEDDLDRLVFPIRLPGRAKVVHAVADAEAAASDGRIPDVVIPFNGVLVTKELVDRIGLPREDFFIWGDDVEFLWRAREAGARCATIVGARVRHPATDDLGTPMMLGRTTYNHSPSDLKHYCMARNNLVNLRDYRGSLHALAFVVKTAWFYSITRPSAARLRMSARAMWAGVRGDFSGHQRFLT